jgi:hypothetical protein
LPPLAEALNVNVFVQLGVRLAEIPSALNRLMVWNAVASVHPLPRPWLMVFFTATCAELTPAVTRSATALKDDALVSPVVHVAGDTPEALVFVSVTPVVELDRFTFAGVTFRS